MTNLDKTLKEIKSRCEAATEGPIVGPLHTEDSKSGFGIYQCPDADTHSFIGDFADKDDCVFYAHARTDVPMLLEMVDVFFKWANNCFCDDDFVCYPCGFKKELEKIAERYSK